MNERNGIILSFGEVLLRMSPQANGGWVTRNQMPVFVGGAEANVATALACWDLPSRYLTALPDNYLGDDVTAYLAQRQIDTAFIHRSGNRVGIYYLQQGADLKHAGVVYDRAHSSFYDLRPGMINWDAALEGVSWLNFSAISPALNEHHPAVCLEALDAAAAKGITISLDLNFRAKLWQWGKRPVEVMPELAAYCDVIMGNIWAANTLLGMPLDKDIEAANRKDAYLEHAERSSRAIMERFPRCRAVANTFRFSEGAGLEYYTALFAGDRQFVSPHFATSDVQDKIGSGDCFMAGLIYGLYNGRPAQEVIDFAAAAAFGKLKEIGDATKQTVAQVHETLQSYLNGQEATSA